MKQLSYISQVFCILFLLCCASSVFAQNLVPNPSFEDFTTCPTMLDQLPNATGWSSPTDGNPDFFHACSTSGDVGVPSNAFGTQTASTGSGYAGIVAFGENEVRDYIQTTLTSPLEIGKSYCVEFRVSLSDEDFYGVQELGMLFSTTPTNVTNGGTALNLTPQIYNMDDVIVENTEWQVISDVLTADQAYQYLSIGNFFSNANTTGGGTFPGAPDILDAYYFIDDVSVQEIEENLVTGVDSQFVCIGDFVSFNAAGASDYVWYDIDNPSDILSTEATLSTMVDQSTQYIVEGMIGSCFVRDTAYVNAVPAPQVNFAVDNACVGGITQFIDLSGNVLPDATYEWDINNDGTIESTSAGAATYVFTEAGTYEVALTIYNNEFCFRSIVNEVVIESDCDPCLNPFSFVPNGDVEEFGMCPDSLTATTLSDVENWFQPTLGTSDFFHTCVPSGSPDDFPGVPVNNFGEQDALSGNGYLGFYAYRQNAPNYREYVSIQLIEPLDTGMSYCVSFNVSLADNTGFGVEELGAYFSTNSPNQNTTNNLAFTPQITNDNGVIVETQDWITISGIFTPTSPVQYLTIGNFSNDANTTTGNNPDAITDFGYHLTSYYYLDDISITVAPSLTVEDAVACSGDVVTLVAPEGFCGYEWYIADDPDVIIGSDNVLEWSAEDIGQIVLAVNGATEACTIIDTVNLNVSAVPEPFFIYVENCFEEAVIFINQSDNVEDGSTFEWDFNGDGLVDQVTEGSTAHYFSSAGTYNTILTITNPSGCIESYSASVVVSADCDPCSPSNLVVNHSFEYFDDCPEELGEIESASDWYSPFAGSPDFYNACSDNGVTGVPNNANGNLGAFDGVGYAGIVAYVEGSPYSEYIGTTLPVPLEVGEQYCFSFQVHISPNSGFAIDKLGAFFSTNEVTAAPTTLTPQAVNETFDIIFQPGWVEISSIFIADSSYRYLTLGNFYQITDNELNVLDIPGGPANDTAYYYIDKVSLVDVELELSGDEFICQGDTATITAETDLCEHVWTIEGQTDTLSTGLTLMATPDTTTTYVYTGSNNECQGVKMTFTVQVEPSPNLGPDLVLCPGDTIQLMDLNNSPAISYMWSPPEGLSCTNCPNPTAVPTVSTTYTLVVQYAEPTTCSTIDDIVITVVDEFADAGLDQEICLGDSTQLQGMGGDLYSWSPIAGLSDANIANPFANPTVNTTYILTVTDTLTGCVDVDTVNVDVFTCDLGGPDWQDSLGVSIDEQCEWVIENDSLMIILPNIVDPDVDSGGDDMLNISFIPSPNSVLEQVTADSVLYIPNIGFTGPDSVYMVVCDTAYPVQCDTLLLCMTVYNTPPSFGVDDLCFNMQNNTVEITCFELEDAQDELQDLVLTILYPVEEEGDVTFADDIYVDDNQCLIYEADPSFIGLTEFVILEACDTEGACDTITVNYHIYPENDPPTIGTTEINAIQGLDLEFCLDIDDPDIGGFWENVFTTELILSTSNGTLTEVGDSCYIYSPDFGFFGLDSLIIETCDASFCNEGMCDDPCPGLCTGPVTVYINVADGLEAVDDYETAEDGNPVIYDVTTNDTPSTVDELYIIDGPDNGDAMVVGGTGGIEYESDNGFIGNDTITYVMCVESLGCDTALVIIEVDDLLAAIIDYDTTLQSTPLDIIVLANDIYPENDDSFEIYISEEPENGTVILNDDGTFTYIPNDGFVGEDRFTYGICIDGLGCELAQVVIEVTPAQSPITVDDMVSTNICSSVVIDVLSNDSDPQGDDLEIKLSNNAENLPDHGIVVIDSLTGNLIYTPDDFFVGTDEFFYRVCNSYGLDMWGEVFVEVTPAQNDTAYTDVGTSVEIDVWNGNYTPGDSLEIEFSNSPSNGTVVADPTTGNLIYTPSEFFIGTDEFFYHIYNDEVSLCGKGTVVVNAPGCDVENFREGIMGGLSPNGDGLNEFWEIPELVLCEELRNNWVRVFNRWGNVVFDQNNYGADGEWWNGTWENNGEALPVGTYFYAIDIEGVDPKDCPRGSIEIFR